MENKLRITATDGIVVEMHIKSFEVSHNTAHTLFASTFYHRNNDGAIMRRAYHIERQATKNTMTRYDVIFALILRLWNEKGPCLSEGRLLQCQWVQFSVRNERTVSIAKKKRHSNWNI